MLWVDVRFDRNQRISRHADQRDVGLPVTPFLRQGIGAGRTALYDGYGTVAALVDWGVSLGRKHGCPRRRALPAC